MSSNIPLPIQLTSFDPSILSNAVQLQWTTASEINNDFFTIERSTDANNWNAIGVVKGAGNSSNNIDYSWMDNTPVSGDSYYRLKQTDFDGKSTYSAVKTVKFTKTENIYLYQIAGNNQQLYFGGLRSDNKYSIAIYNTAGMLMYKSNLNTNNVQLPNLQKAVYVVQIVNVTKNTNSQLKFVI